MSTHSLAPAVACPPRASRAPFFRVFSGLISAPVSGLVALMGLHRERRALRHMDATLLKDIGLTREQAHMEAARPIWDMPSRPF